MSRTTRFIRMACRATEKVDRKCEFRIGAVVAQGSRFLSSGCNSSKTHPQNPKLNHKTPRTQLCAEVVAAIRAKKVLKRTNLNGCSIYVARKKWNKTEDLSIARPCRFCIEFLKEVGISNIFYTNRVGDVEQMVIV